MNNTIPLRSAPSSRIHASPRAWLAGFQQPRRGQDQKHPHFIPLLILSQRYDIGKSPRHVSCLNFEREGHQANKFRSCRKIRTLQALSNHKFRLAGRGDSWTGGLPERYVNISRLSCQQIWSIQNSNGWKKGESRENCCKTKCFLPPPRLGQVSDLTSLHYLREKA